MLRARVTRIPSGRCPPGLAQDISGTRTHDCGWAGNQQGIGSPGTGVPDRDPAVRAKLSEIHGEPHARGSHGSA